LRRQVRADAGPVCGYCHSPEALVGMPLVIEHLIATAAGGPTTRENLWLACYRCNEFKGDRIAAVDPASGERVALYNPRSQPWGEHFAWSPDGLQVAGVTPVGRATVALLHLNNAFVVAARRFWVRAGWWPPTDDPIAP
jgi:hypothetical protein